MSIFSSLLKTGASAAMGTASFAGRVALQGGVAGRVALGATIGGIVGGVTSDKNDPTQKLESVFRGAALGAGAGLLASAPSLAMKARKLNVATGQNRLRSQMIKNMGVGQKVGAELFEKNVMGNPALRKKFVQNARQHTPLARANIALRKNAVMKEMGGKAVRDEAHATGNLRDYNENVTQEAMRTGPLRPANIAKKIGAIAGEGVLLAANNPFTTLGVLGAAAYLNSDRTPYYSVMNDTGAHFSSTLNQEAAAMDDLQGALPRGGAGNYLNSPVGMPATAIRQQTFASSTTGLVQGLFNRRH